MTLRETSRRRGSSGSPRRLGLPRLNGRPTNTGPVPAQRTDSPDPVAVRGWVPPSTLSRLYKGPGFGSPSVPTSKEEPSEDTVADTDSETGQPSRHRRTPRLSEGGLRGSTVPQCLLRRRRQVTDSPGRSKDDDIEPSGTPDVPTNRSEENPWDPDDRNCPLEQSGGVSQGVTETLEPAQRIGETESHLTPDDK